MKTKLFTLFLALAASVGTIFAESGTCGDNLTWNLTNGVLTISGTGAMNDFSYSSAAPWYSYCNSISSLIINNGVTSIGDYAFDNYVSLTSVTIPNSVTVIGRSAFSKCYGLAAVHINGLSAWCNISFYSESSNPLYYAKHLYLNGTEITNLVIPGDVTEIKNYAFCYCTSLTYVTIPNSVISIGGAAFDGCTGLISITIPNSVTSIGNQAFYYCTGLTSVTIPNSVTSIGPWAFIGCTGLTSVTVPASSFEIPETYWVNCTHSLQSVTFNGGELTYNVLGVLARSYKTLTSLDISGVSNAELGDEAFKGFYNLQSLVLPSNLTKIGYMAVADCKNLQSIDIPASVTEISQSAFENCRSLKTITFGGQAANLPGRLNVPTASTSQLQTIGNWAFYNCHELQNLTIPEGLSYGSTGDGAFYGCVYLEDLSLPASVQSIGDNCFALCSKLKKIIVNAPVPPSIQAKTFYDVKRQIPVYVPDESVNAYKNDAQWREFNIQGISDMPMALDQISQQPIVNSQKLIKDGQIFILRGDKTYTLTGQEVK